MARPSEKDIEGSYQVLVSLLDRLTDPVDLPVMVEQILGDIRSSATDKPGLRYERTSQRWERVVIGWVG